MKRFRYLGLAVLVLALSALIPDRPPADAVDAWDVELSELMEFAPPGSVLHSPAMVGIDAEFASYETIENGAQAMTFDPRGDCYAFMRGGESTVAGPLELGTGPSFPSSFLRLDKLVYF